MQSLDSHRFRSASDRAGEAPTDVMTDAERLEMLRDVTKGRHFTATVGVMVLHYDWLCELAQEALDGRE